MTQTKTNYLAKSKLTPTPYQKGHFSDYQDFNSHLYYWECGTGKTKTVIDNACFGFHKGELNFILVIAPSGVDKNWEHYELPKNLLDSTKKHCQIELYNSKNDRETEINSIRSLRKYKYLSIVIIDYKALECDELFDCLKDLLENKKGLIICDECHRLQQNDGGQVMRIMKLKDHAKHRVGLSGTPLATGLHDFYRQIRFVNNEVLIDVGIKSYAAFKRRFIVNPQDKPKHWIFQNWNELYDIMKPIMSRILKNEALPNLPERFYHDITYDKMGQQEHDYNEHLHYLIQNEWHGDPDIISLNNGVNELMKILCGYPPITADFSVSRKYHHRLMVLSDLIKSISDEPTVIWVEYKEDVAQISELLTDLEIPHVKYGGDKKATEIRSDELLKFQNGDVRFIICTYEMGATGINLRMAGNVIRYSHCFSYTNFIQSENRSHGIGSPDRPVHYYRIVCNDSVDESIKRRHKEIQGLSDLLFAEKYGYMAERVRDE